MQSETYLIPEHRLEEAKARIEKLNRKGLRLGTGGVQMTVGQSKFVPLLNQKYVSQQDAERYATSGLLQYVKFVEVAVTGTTPSVKDYTLVAVLHHLVDEGGERVNLLKVSPPFEANIPQKFRSALPEHCDHCNVSIKTRKETFVVQNDFTKEYKQVGRNCLVDFLGGADPKAAICSFQIALEVRDYLAGQSSDTKAENSYCSLEYFVATAVMLIETYGWLSKTEAYKSNRINNATANMAVNYLTSSRESNFWHQFKLRHPITQKHVKFAEIVIDKVREHLDSKNNLSDYEHNLKVCLSLPAVDQKTFGIVASAVPFFNKLTGVDPPFNANSQYIGNVGQDITSIKVTLLGESTYTGHYALSWVYRFLTHDGNHCTWFTSKKQNLRIGERYVISKAVVKKHSEHRGIKQTSLTRVFFEW